MSVPARSYAAAVAAGHLTLEEVRAEMEASDEHREMLAAQRRREKTRMHIVETETEPPFHIVVVSAPNAVARVSDALVRVPDERGCPRCSSSFLELPANIGLNGDCRRERSP